MADKKSKAEKEVEQEESKLAALTKNTSPESVRLSTCQNQQSDED